MNGELDTWSLWTRPSLSPQYYPLVFTTLRIERLLFGGRAAGFHAVNVLLHAATAIMLWRALKRLSVPGAWIGAALFVTHPVHVESVAWITERKNVLSGAFYLASTLCFLDFAGVGRPQSASWRKGAASFALFVAALLSKSVTATLPAALALVLVWRKGRLARREWIALAAMQAVGLASGIFTAVFEKREVGAFGPEWSLSLADHVLLAGRVPWFYLWKLAWPHPLVFIYPRWTLDAHAPWQWVFPAGAAALLAALVLLRRRLGAGPLVALLFFGGTLVPVLGLVAVFPMRFSFVADHFQYLASVGPLALAGAALARLGSRKAPAAVAIVAAMILKCWSLAPAYENQRTLWKDVLEQNAGAFIAHLNYGKIIMDEEGRLPEAVGHFRESLRLKSDYPEGENNLGLALGRLGAFDESIVHFQKALALLPQYADAHSNYAVVLDKKGRTKDAVVEYERALELNAGLVEARYNLYLAYRDLGNLDAAKRHLMAAVSVFADEGRRGPAVAMPEALEVLARPDDAAAHVALGSRLVSRSRPNFAVPHFLEALRLDPQNEDARVQLEQVAGTNR